MIGLVGVGLIVCRFYRVIRGEKTEFARRVRFADIDSLGILKPRVWNISLMLLASVGLRRPGVRRSCCLRGKKEAHRDKSMSSLVCFRLRTSKSEHSMSEMQRMFDLRGR